ncbi:hypothetical protein [Lactobacillus xylocopicola]|uniref:Lactococcin 972 family bacteriocin n=1 Tax=Lactobacillus xylocopicola TaxID=2976676 RepID=A0ABN6SNL2_9LACO|nr:hypothetical protein [Lactobacillus xylocopicola]BDR61254.1 hypothetical protein KIM322_15150 [Lactobacillus xylocopicola]
MKNKFTKATALSLAIFSLGSAIQAAPVLAQTVYYKGSRINWDYGRRMGAWSYSNVSSHKYSHSATANSSWSGWKSAGTTADAQQFVGTGTAYGYWDARG